MPSDVAVSGFAGIRKRAAEHFEAHGFPTTREEEWRFTSVAPIAKAGFATAAPKVSAHSLRAALERYSQLIEEHLGHYARYEDNPFVALNTVNFEDGAFVHIPANTVIDEPLWIEFTAVPERATHPRNLIVVGAGSQVRIVE